MINDLVSRLGPDMDGSGNHEVMTSVMETIPIKAKENRRGKTPAASNSTVCGGDAEGVK